MAETVTMPKLGFDMAEGTLVRWVKVEGEAVKKGEVLAEIETDKATVEVESSFNGEVLRHLVEQGAIVPVGKPIAIIGEPGEKIDAAGTAVPTPAAAQAARTAAVAAPAGSPGAGPAEPAAAVTGGRTVASPLARHMAEAKNLDLSQVRGTGPGGRVVKKDVELALQTLAQAPAVQAPVIQAPAQPQAVKAAPAPQAAPAITPTDEVIPVNKLRAAIARRMTESKQQLPHFYVTHEYKMDALLELRKELNAFVPEEKKLSVNDFVVKAVALTLRQFPNLNASIAGNQIIRHGAVNVGVAVSVEGGLLTIVNRSTDQKPLALISTEIKDLVARARAGKVRPDDIEGSTFSISNLGMFDVESFIAIINPPEAAILAVGSARQVPVVEDGQLKVGTRMRATLSADHRVTDGVEAAQFLQALAQYLEKPLRLLL
jgi:pyruvate dehydrogenase E2 component (dihydrolipoamide acetyltransferase)